MLKIKDIKVGEIYIILPRNKIFSIDVVKNVYSDSFDSFYKTCGVYGSPINQYTDTFENLRSNTIFIYPFENWRENPELIRHREKIRNIRKRIF